VGLASFVAPQDDALPVGTIMAWAGEQAKVPSDWMICDGKALKIAQYEKLFVMIGWSWGKPGGKKFNLPDLRGRFMRGVDDGVRRDPDVTDREASNRGGNTRGVGSVQDDAIQEHAHYQLEHRHIDYHSRLHKTGGLTSGTDDICIYTSDYWTETIPVAPAISGPINYKNHAEVKLSEETRPKNANVYFIIKVK